MVGHRDVSSSINYADGTIGIFACSRGSRINYTICYSILDISNNLACASLGRSGFLISWIPCWCFLYGDYRFVCADTKPTPSP